MRGTLHVHKPLPLCVGRTGIRTTVIVEPAADGARVPCLHVPTDATVSSNPSLSQHLRVHAEPRLLLAH